jgi:LPXTG-motif cell wall-anchored protein
LNSKKFFHSLLIFLCTFFLIIPLTNVTAKSDNQRKSNHHKQIEIHDNKDSKIHHKKNHTNKYSKIHHNKQTQIHLHLNKCSKISYSHVYVKLRGEWKELTNQGKSPLYRLLDRGQYISDDISEYKFISGTSEVVVPITRMKVGVEANGTVNYWLPKCPKVQQTQKKTTTQIKTEISHDVKGSYKLTLKQPPKSKSTVRHTQIHLHLQKCAKDFSKVYVQINRKWVELKNQGSSPLYKLLDQGMYVKDDITAFKLVAKTGAEVIVPVSQLKVGVEAEGTINYWLLICPKIDKPVDGGTNPPVKDENKMPEPSKINDLKPKPPKNGEAKPTPPKNPGSKAGESVTRPKGTDQPKGPNPPTFDNKGTKSETPPRGLLPQTGESSSAWYYILGFILLVIGTILVNLKKGRK